MSGRFVGYSETLLKNYIVIGDDCDSPTEDSEIVINNWHFFDDGTIQYRSGERVMAPEMVTMLKVELSKCIEIPMWVVVDTHNGEASHCSMPMSYSAAMKLADLDPVDYPDESNHESRDGLGVHVLFMGM